MIFPGQTIGVLGGGPIGRMLTQAAQALGYRVHVFDPLAGCAAANVADQSTIAAFEDVGALKAFARDCAVITSAFEDIPSEPLAAIAPIVPLCPKADVLRTTQNRQREKAWLRASGLPHVRYAEALDGDIRAVIAQVGRPCVVKTADFEYDGRGQMKVTTDDDLERACAIFRGRRCVLERWMDFSCELGVIIARSSAGEVKPFPVVENIHRRQVLDISIAPARVSAAIEREAVHLATTIAEKLGVVGLLAAEMFVMPNGEVLVNELAPRADNSGHWTLDGCETSQFEQQVRAICGLPLGAVAVRDPTISVNILGDAWRWHDGKPVQEPDWNAVLAEPRAKLYVYGAGEPRLGRKMGHFTVRDSSLDVALARAREIKLRLHRAMQ